MWSAFQSNTGLDLNSAFDALTETVQSVTEQVQEAIPEKHKDFLAKITLNTEEMVAERANFKEEASRKDQTKNILNKILPWETLDPEREILVEECKEAILELSGRESTFFGPYEMPLLNVQLETTNSNDDDDDDAEEQEEAPEVGGDNDNNNNSNDGDSEGDANESDGDAAAAEVSEEPTPEEEPEPETRPRARHMMPSEESLEMLAKLQPLPPLLEDFDLDTYVGLIQSVMKEDPKLVGMQANFSGGGARERVFWRNYFFHCAFARYEAGLTLDEIWSYTEESYAATHAEDASPEDGGDEGIVASSAAAEHGTEEETMVFDGSGDDSQAVVVDNESAGGAAISGVAEELFADDIGTANESGTDLSELSPTNGFQLVDDEDIDVPEDSEMDELEAEIARELENM